MSNYQLIANEPGLDLETDKKEENYFMENEQIFHAFTQNISEDSYKKLYITPFRIIYETHYNDNEKAAFEHSKTKVSFYELSQVVIKYLLSLILYLVLLKTPNIYHEERAFIPMPHIVAVEDTTKLVINPIYTPCSILFSISLISYILDIIGFALLPQALLFVDSAFLLIIISILLLFHIIYKCNMCSKNKNSKIFFLSLLCLLSNFLLFFVSNYFLLVATSQQNRIALWLIIMIIVISCILNTITEVMLVRAARFLITTKATLTICSETEIYTIGLPKNDATAACHKIAELCKLSNDKDKIQ